jgi:hypothetical protein
MTAPQQPSKRSSSQPRPSGADADTSGADLQAAQDPADIARSTAEPAPKDEAALQHEIEHTREQLGETVTALTTKLDVKDRVRTRMSQAATRATGTARRVRTSARRRLVRPAAAARRRRGPLVAAGRKRMRRPVAVVRRHPTPWAAGLALVMAAGAATRKRKRR